MICCVCGSIHQNVVLHYQIGLNPISVTRPKFNADREEIDDDYSEALRIRLIDIYKITDFISFTMLYVLIWD